MSKQRAIARAAREAEAVRRAAEHAESTRRAVAARSRRERRAATWRRLRLWQSRPSRHSTERRAVIGTLTLVVVVLAYVVTGSITAVVLVLLVLLIALPMLAYLLSDRSRS